jgi:hypothetical protein
MSNLNIVSGSIELVFKAIPGEIEHLNIDILPRATAISYYGMKSHDWKCEEYVAVVTGLTQGGNLCDTIFAPAYFNTSAIKSMLECENRPILEGEKQIAWRDGINTLRAPIKQGRAA